GTTEIGVISLGGLVISKSIRTAGDKLDMSIVNYVKEKYNLIIGERTGEEIKITIGSAIQLPKELSMVVKGRDQVSGLLSRIELTSEDVREAMREYLKEIADALKMVLEMMPPDLASDIVENGVVLTGGGALIRGLDKYLSEIVRLPVYIADEPFLAVAKGTGKALEEISLLQQLTNEE
ncbi:rod shape-determining protein, partial [Campylobacter sp. BCW_8712]